ncbi:F-box protein family-like [Rhynchospora pubera]|uniref:F-box protein family-like n=1 Tax=Rhynchospora pubera TaxID=906938 RepID=A0AAV8H9Y3_9POAL|nr:F-box protein family-like [Rhynchospora pubera]
MPRPKSMFPCGFDDQPWLIQARGSDKETQMFINPLNGSIEERNISEMHGQLCLSRFEEWLFLVDDLSDDCFLLNINSLTKIDLPPIEEPFSSLGFRILTSSPTSPDCTIIFLGLEENFLLFCHPCDTEWTKLPVDFDVDRVRNMFAYKGNLYVILHDIEIINLASLSTCCVESISMDRPDLSSFGIGSVEHLLESCGDIFFVRMRFPGLPMTTSIVDIEIYKLLDFEDEYIWLRVESIGDRAFLLDQNGGQSFCTQDTQFDKDCVYHILPCYDGERMYKICLEDQTIEFKLLTAEAAQTNYFSYWILTVRRPIQNDELLTSFETIACSEVCQNGCGMVKKDENVGAVYISMPLTNLPIDIVQSISEQLPLKDSVRLRAVCKLWAKQLPDPMKEEPMWLMSCPKKCGTCQMYSPCKGKQFTLNLKGLSSSDVPTRLLFSKDGWILALKGFNLLCLMNPFTNDFHHLPILEDDYSYNGIAFSCPPKNTSNCMVLAIFSPPRGDFTRIIAWHYGQEEWFEMQFDNDLPFSGTDNNPVFFNGEFYCLGRRGNLGVFNPENKEWRVLDKPSPIHSEAPDIGTEHCYLLECDGELISVFRAFNMKYVRVFKLDRSNMAWNLLEDIGDVTLFLDNRTSIARNLPRKSFGNKVFLPRLHDESNETTFYYCMKTGMHNPNFKIFREPYNCVWLEPNFSS